MEVVTSAPSAATPGPLGAPRPTPITLAAIGVGLAGVVVATATVALSGDTTEVPWQVGSALGVAVSTVVAWRRPQHLLVPWFCLLTTSVTWIYTTQTLIRWQVDGSGSARTVALLVISMHLAAALSTAAAVRVFVRFPTGVDDGRLGRWVERAVDALQVARLAVVVLSDVVAVPAYISDNRLENPLQVSGVGVGSGVVTVVTELANAVAFLALVMLARRYRRADGIIRRRIRWLLLPLAAGAISFAADTLLGFTADHTGALVTLAITSALMVGIGLGIAGPSGIDADTVLRQSLLWGAIWVVIAAVYVGVSAALGVTVGERWSVGWAVTMTVLAMLALQPVRAGLERLVNWRIFGPPSDPRRTIERLGRSLAGTYDLDTLLPRIELALEEGLGLEWARVRLLPSGSDDDRQPALTVPIELDGEEVGMVECGGRRNGSAVTADDVAVVGTLARQAAMAVRNVRLTSQLRARSAELAASRSRLVRAEEAERRRIERDIHDGAQQELVALIGHAGLIRRQLQRMDTSSAETVDEIEALQSGLERVLSELRDLAAGIHSSVLRDRGLLAAIEGLAARHPVPVDMRSDADVRHLRLSPEVESAGYFTVCETLANSLKHSRAERVTIDCRHAEGLLSITVSDDGVGFDPGTTDRHGNGLVNITERVAAIDGRLTVDARPEGGTRITIVLPTVPHLTHGAIT